MFIVKVELVLKKSFLMLPSIYFHSSEKMGGEC